MKILIEKLFLKILLSNNCIVLNDTFDENNKKSLISTIHISALSFIAGVLLKIMNMGKSKYYNV